MPRHDTIVALITGPPPAAVAVLRVSGPDAVSVARAVFAPFPDPVVSHVVTYGRFAHADDGLLLPFLDGRGYTGEEAVEMSIHGSRASIVGLLDACTAAGARMAEPGEFTQRAFLNRRLDLSQAEAVADIVNSETELQLRVAQRNFGGALKGAVTPWRDRALGLLALIEATIDFSEDIGELDYDAVANESKAIALGLGVLAQTAETARIVRDGLRVAIVGRPNAGKSSLLNALARAERAIVTSIAGTTRDLIEECVEIGGVRVILTDTAGLRETEDEVEAIGVARARRAIQEADVVWYVFDATAGLAAEDERLIAEIARPVTLLANKSDLATAPTGLAISATTGAGLDQLVAPIRMIADGLPTFSVGPRQEGALRSASASMAELAEAAKQLAPPDLLAVLGMDAITAIDRVIGQAGDAEILTEIFSRFCIGK